MNDDDDDDDDDDSEWRVVAAETAFKSSNPPGIFFVKMHHVEKFSICWLGYGNQKCFVLQQLESWDTF